MYLVSQSTGHEARWRTVNLEEGIPENTKKVSIFLTESPVDRDDPYRYNTYYGPLFFDIDAPKTNAGKYMVDKAIDAALAIVKILKENYNVAEQDINIALSGTKGVHIWLHPLLLTDITEPDYYLKRAMRGVATRLWETAAIELPMDYAPYNEGGGNTVYIEGMYREEKGAYKSKISLSTLESIRTHKEYKDFVEDKERAIPLQESLTSRRWMFSQNFEPTNNTFDLKELYEVEYDSAVELDRSQQSETSDLLSDDQLNLIRDEQPKCINYALASPDSTRSDRDLQHLLCSYVATAGKRPQQYISLHGKVIDARKGDSKDDKRRKKLNLQAQYRTVINNVKFAKKYQFTCKLSYRKLKGFNRSECRGCPVHLDRVKDVDEAGAQVIDYLDSPYEVVNKGLTISYKEAGSSSETTYDLIAQVHKPEVYWIQAGAEGREAECFAGFLIKNGGNEVLITPAHLTRDLSGLAELLSKNKMQLKQEVARKIVDELESLLFQLAYDRETKRVKNKMIMIKHIGLVFDPKTEEVGWVVPDRSVLIRKGNLRVEGCYLLSKDTLEYFESYPMKLHWPRSEDDAFAHWTGEKLIRTAEAGLIKYLEAFIGQHYDYVTHSSLAWACSALFKPIIQKKRTYFLGRFHPALALNGKRRSGKTELARQLMIITGSLENNEFLLSASSNSEAHTRNTIARLSGMATLLDEANRQDKGEETAEEIKNIVDMGHLKNEGRGDGKVYMTYVCSVILAGEIAIENDALLSRSISLTLPTDRKRDIDLPHAWEHFAIAAGQKDKFGSLLFNLLFLKVADQTISPVERLAGYLQRADEQIRATLEGIRYDQRTFGGAGVLLAGLYLLEDVLNGFTTEHNLDFSAMQHTVINHQFNLDYGNNGQVSRREEITAVHRNFRTFWSVQSRIMRDYIAAKRSNKNAQRPSESYGVIWVVDSGEVLVASSDVYLFLKRNQTNKGSDHDLKQLNVFIQNLEEKFTRKHKSGMTHAIPELEFCSLVDTTPDYLVSLVNDYSSATNDKEPNVNSQYYEE